MVADAVADHLSDLISPTTKLSRKQDFFQQSRKQSSSYFLPSRDRLNDKKILSKSAINYVSSNEMIEFKLYFGSLCENHSWC